MYIGILPTCMYECMKVSDPWNLSYCCGLPCRCWDLNTGCPLLTPSHLSSTAPPHFKFFMYGFFAYTYVYILILCVLVHTVQKRGYK